MPVPSIKALAKKAGKSEKEAEKLWAKAKKIAEEERGKKEKDFKDKDYAYTMGIFKNMLGIKESKVKEGATTTIVIADKKTGSTWGGVWGDPKSQANKDRLQSIIAETGNKNYEIMEFDDALAIEKKYKNIKESKVADEKELQKEMQYYIGIAADRGIYASTEREAKALSKIENPLGMTKQLHDYLLADYEKRAFNSDENAKIIVLLNKVQNILNLFVNIPYLEKKIIEDKKVSFLESDMNAKNWLETQFPPEGNIDETMTSGPIVATGLPENPVPVEKEKEEVEQKFDDREQIVDDREPLDQ